MRIARRTLLASAAAMIAAPAVLRFARADTNPQVVLKLHHFMSSVSSAHDKFIVPWARKVQADSGNRIRIDLFPSMQLGGAPAHLFDQARDGEVDIAWTAPALTPGRFPRIEMFDLPFVPSRRALVSSKALADFAAANLKDEFREVRPLGFSCTDRGVMHANQPIRTVEDIKDLKIHVPTRWAGEALALLGAQPVPMPPGQLPAAINAHVIDGCLDAWHLMPGLRLNDMLKMHTEFADTSPSSTTFVLVMNSAAYDRLPRDLKSVIDSNSGQASAGMAGAMWDLEAASVSDAVVRGGDSIVTLLPESVARWRKLTEPVVEKWVKAMKEQKTDGGKLLATAHALMVKYISEPDPQPPQLPAQQPSQQPAQQSAVTQPPQTVSPQPQTVSPPQVPQATLTSPATTASTPPSAPANTPLIKPVPPQPPAPAVHVATPSPASAPAPVTVAKPVPPAAPAPQIAAPAPAPIPAPPSTATIVPAAKPAATVAPAPSAAAPAPHAATAAPATKPAAAPSLAPKPPPAAAPATAAAPPAPPAAPAPAPKSLDIPL